VSYRDERDALRDRVVNLEEELAAAREDRARGEHADRETRIAELEAQMAEGRRLLDRMGAELGALRGTPPKPADEGDAAARRTAPPSEIPVRAPAWVLAGVVVVALGIVAFVHTRRAQVPPPSEAPATTPASTVAPARVDEPAPAATSAVPKAYRAPTMARWRARATRVTGRGIALGASCLVEATLEGDKSDIRVQRLSVGCGGASLYDSSAPLDGMSMSSVGVQEEAGPAPGTLTYAIQYQDKGTRSGSRSEASIDSIKGVGAVWSDTMPAFRVELAVPYLSEAARGEPILASSQALRRVATVVHTEGAAPLLRGARCDLRVTPRQTAGECMVRLTCGREVLYGKGATGVAACTVQDGRVLRVTDTEPTSNGRDPELDVNTEAGSMVLADEVGGARGARWSVGFELEKPD
jgi:hypothetical protein